MGRPQLSCAAAPKQPRQHTGQSPEHGLDPLSGRLQHPENHCRHALQRDPSGWIPSARNSETEQIRAPKMASGGLRSRLLSQPLPLKTQKIEEDWIWESPKIRCLDSGLNDDR